MSASGPAGGAQLLRGRILLTGATGGLGHAIARALAAHGGELLLSGRRADRLEPVAAELGGRALPGDLGDRDAVRRLAEAAGPVDVLVANAGLPAVGPLDDFTPEEVDRALDVNLRAPVQLAHALTPGMVARGRGHVVAMNSLSGKFATGGQALYTATKFGLRGFMLALREDLAPTGVGVSTVFPGFVRDAGMFADAGVRLPPYVRTSAPGEVAAAVVRAVLEDRAEIDVAPLPARAVALLSGAFPAASHTVRRRIPANERIVADLARSEAQRAKR